MQLTNRDKVLVLIIPATLVLGGYGYWYNYFAGKPTEMNRLQKGADDAVRTAPQEEEDLQRSQAHQQSLTFAVSKLQADLAREKQRWEASAGAVFNPATRHDRVGRLNALLVGYGLALISDAPGDSAANPADVRTSPALEAFAKGIAERSPQLKPQPWRLRLYGRYPDVRLALAKLAEGDALCVPVGLTMKEWDLNAPGQEWTLLVWI